MRILNISTDKLIPYENNPRNNDAAVQYVANSIREFGFKVPIVIDRENVVVTGHTRLKAAKLLGLDKVPCIRADNLKTKLGEKDLRAASKTIVENAYKSSGGKNGTYNFAKGISGYATKNYAECVAEATADWYCNGNNASKASKAIISEMKRINAL